MKIIWSKRSRLDYYKVLDYLQDNWGEKEVKAFIKKTNETLNIITLNPQAFVATSKRKNVHKALVKKHNSLFYQVRPHKKEITLLTFWDNRQDLERLNY